MASTKVTVGAIKKARKKNKKNESKNVSKKERHAEFL